eukprot:ctg_1118.g342
MDPAVTLPNLDIHLLYNTAARRSSHCPLRLSPPVFASLRDRHRRGSVARELPRDERKAVARQLRVREEAAGEKDEEGLRSEQWRLLAHFQTHHTRTFPASFCPDRRRAMVLNGRPGALGSGAGWTQGARQVEAAGADRDKQAPQVDEEYARPRLRLRRYEESAEAGSPGGAAAATRVSSPMRTANGFPSDVPLRSASGQQHTTPGMGDRRVNGTPDRLRSGHRSERRRPPVGRREAAMLLRAQVGAAHGTAASSTGPPARQYAENDRRGRYSLRQAKRHARYVDDDDSDESFTRTGGAENGGIGQPRYALRNHTSHGAEKRVCRFSVSSSASSGRSRHRSRSRPTRSRRYEEPSFNDDEEACSSEEVDALFAAEEARELQEAEELERTVKLDDDASGSVSEKADDSESDDRKMTISLDPACRQRTGAGRRSAGCAAQSPSRSLGGPRRADALAATVQCARRALRRRLGLDVGGERRGGLESSRETPPRGALRGIAPINMDMGGTASGGLASRSPQGHMQPDRLRANALEPLRVDPHLTWDRVGGLEHHVRALKEMVFLPLVYPEFFQRFQSEPPRGVLFYGPPGTGKTLVARTLAATCAAASGARVAFFMRNGADCLSKWHCVHAARSDGRAGDARPNRRDRRHQPHRRHRPGVAAAGALRPRARVRLAEPGGAAGDFANSHPQLAAAAERGPTGPAGSGHRRFRRGRLALAVLGGGAAGAASPIPADLRLHRQASDRPGAGASDRAGL